MDPLLPTLQQRLDQRLRPARAPVGFQRWSDLLFLHWEVTPEAIQQTLPAGLTVDTHEGRAYLGIVPFFMQRIRPMWLPAVPWLSWFLELNVRTYVHDATGRPGVYFYSLDCNQPVAVMLARRFFHLPYFHARMQAVRKSSHVLYQCQRRLDAETAHYEWCGGSSLYEAEPGSLEFFLVERYQLFTARRDGTLVNGQVHHAPYRIGPVEVKRFTTYPAKLAGFTLDHEMIPPLHAAAVDVSVFAVKTIIPA